jgi:glutamate--cysteine ligase
MSANQITIVEHGRRPGLMLARTSGPVSREAWSREILEGCRPLAELLDRATGGDAYIHAWEEQRRKVDSPDLTPSARILDIMRNQSIPFFRFALNQSIAHKGYFDEHRLRDQQLADYRLQAERSLAEQAEIEAADVLDFDSYLASYLALG